MNQQENSSTLKVAMPRKGRIASSLSSLFINAGYEWPINDKEGMLFARLSKDIEAMYIRTTDIPEIVADNIVNLGITGTDLVEESGCNVKVIQELNIFKCRLVLAASPQWAEKYNKKKQNTIRIATSFPKITRKWAQENGLDIMIVPLSGSVEIAPRLGIADVVVDLTQTGVTLRNNGLIEVETIRDVKACIVAPGDFDIESTNTESLQTKIFADTLMSVLNARGKRYLMMNAPKSAIDEVRKIIPGLTSPTVLDLFQNSDVVAIHEVVDFTDINVIVPKLRALGVKGILVSSIEKLIP